LTKLGTGTLRVDRAGGQQSHFFVEGGVAQMKDNKLTILTSQAIPAAQIDADSARAELAEAEARRPTDAATAAERQKQIARAKAKQKLAGQR
jgi:F-type H+-transporting ATPase subunit epsilon